MAQPRPLWKRIAFAVCGLLVAMALLIGAGLLALNTGAGRGWVKDQVAGLEFENGLSIGVGAIDGSLYSAMVLRDLTLSDPQGVFASAPDVEVDWSPFAFLFGHVDIDAVAIETATLSRVPEFNETAPSDAPLLPDYTIDIGRFAIERLMVDAPVTGGERIATATAKVWIEDGRADVTLTANSLASGPDEAQGDVVDLVLAAVPQEDRLDLDLDLSAPGDGVVAALAGWSGDLDATLKGEGSWSQWDGRFTAGWAGQPLAALDLTARDGVFTANGPAQLGSLVPGTVAALFAGEAMIDAQARLDEASTALDASLTTQALTTTAEGALAFEASRFDDLKVQLAISGVTPLGPGVTGSGLIADVTLDGAFAKPNVAYDLTARRLAYAGVGLEGVTTSGETRVDLEDMIVPVDARARRVTGLDQAAGGPLTDARLTGDILVAWPRILSDNLRLLSPRLDAGLTLVANAEAGRYGGAIDGRLGDYRIESVGLFDIATGADLNLNTNTGVALQGSVQARSTRLTNESVAAFLGGDMVASSDVAYGRDGVTRLSNIRLSSPLVSVDAGEGTYGADGTLNIVASGVSDDYGPLGLQLVGTATSPVATINAPSPGLGVGLVNVTAQVRGEGTLYTINAAGETDFGPFSALVSADFASGPTTLDIEASDLGGIGLTGRLRQTAAGPYDGELMASGNGVTGRVHLFGEGEVQLAKVNARASDVVLPGAARTRIGRAVVDADVAFYETPRVSADVQLANARYFDTVIDTLRAEIDLADGKGTAKALASGRNSVPFTIAANADLQPDIWRAAIKGNVRGVNFRSDGPARIIPPFADGSQDEAYQLLPTRLRFNRADVRVSGRFGTAIELKTRVDAFDLAILNRFVSGLGLSGKASGSLDFAQAVSGEMPVAQGQFEVEGFSRSTALTVSRPVDLTLAGQIGAGGATGRAVVKQGGKAIGRVHTDLALTGGAQASWVDRLLNARLGGGLRYNGSAANLFSLAGLADQELTGVVGVAADFSGRPFEPILDGVVLARDLTYENQTYGTRLSGLNARGRFDGDQLVIEQFEAQAGKGRVSATGVMGLAAEQGFPMDIALALDNAQLARSDEIGARATGDLTITKRAGERALLAGTLTLPETRYVLSYVDTSEVPELAGVRFVGDDLDAARVASAADAKPAEPGFEDLRLDLKLVAADELFVTGFGLDSEWRADLRVTGTSADPRLRGEIELVRGTLDFAGRAFDMQNGSIRFTGGPSLEPRLSISATETIQDVAVSVDVEGGAFSPEIEFSSSPGLPQDEILARILFGSSIANLSALEAVQLAQSLNTLSGSGSGLNPLGTLQSATGLDRLRLVAANEATGQGTALAAGQYISDDIYVEVITDARGFTATQLEISLSRTLSVLSQASGVGGTNVSVRYRKDY